MAQRKVGMKKARTIIELHEKSKLSNRQIGKAVGLSRPAVAKYLAAFKNSGLSMEEALGLPDSVLDVRLAGPQKPVDGRLADAVAFFPYMAKELPKVGVTRDILWNEYVRKHRRFRLMSGYINVTFWSILQDFLPSIVSKPISKLLVISYIIAECEIDLLWKLPEFRKWEA